MFGFWKRSLEHVEPPFRKTANPYDFDPVDDVSAVEVTGRWHPKMTTHIRKKDIRGLLLNPHKGFECDDYGFLSDFDHLEMLILGQPRSAGYSGPLPLGALAKLRRFSATFALPEAVDFTSMPALQSCGLKWTPKVNSIFGTKALKRLYMTSLSVTKADHLAGLTSLQNLELHHSGIKSFAPLAELGNLSRLHLSVCRGLQDFKGIEKLSNLRLLHLDEVHKLHSLECLASLENLEVLVMRDCGELASLAPLAHLKNLKAVSFDGARTTVLDGNLAPLTKLPNLSMVSFGQRRHYTHRLTKRWNWNNLHKPDKMLVAA